MQGLIGKKVGMTQVYDDRGQQVAVTVIEAGPCVVVRRKTADRDGYDAVQVGFGDQKAHRVTKPAMGAFKAAGGQAKRCLREFALDHGEDFKPGDTVGVAIFDGVTHVDVTGITKGRGFQGVVRRYRMGGGPLTHGGHSKRRIGSIGQNAYPSRVHRGHRMPGHMGNVRVTQQNLKVVSVRPDDNLRLVHGAVPGPSGAIVLVKKALKKGNGKA